MKLAYYYNFYKGKRINKKGREGILRIHTHTHTRIQIEFIILLIFLYSFKIKTIIKLCFITSNYLCHFDGK